MTCISRSHPASNGISFADRGDGVLRRANPLSFQGRPAMLARVPSRPRAFATLMLAAIALSFTFMGCPCISGPVNASPGLRWFLFSNFGAAKICPEMLKSGVALRLQDRAPAIGRFFPMRCTYNVDDASQTVTVHVGGTGYGYMLPAKRVGFSLAVSVEYRPDFQIAGDDVYVW